jgi:hypothetical protein
MIAWILSRGLRALRAIVFPFGYDVRRSAVSTVDPSIREIVNRVRPFSMTSDERLLAVCDAVDYVTRFDIAGDFVECGVWRGGSTMAAALAFRASGDCTRRLYLFDTFDGMTAPTESDRCLRTGRSAAEVLAAASKRSNVWARAAMEDVERNLVSTGYPRDRVIMVKGPVEDTLPAAAPERIAILRLDTDWYESTQHELAHLFPRLSPGGVLIIDDYGHWAGARRAVDEYFEEKRLVMYLSRIDHTGRIGIKPENKRIVA